MNLDGTRDLERFTALIEQRLGLHFDGSRGEFLADVLRERTAASGNSNPNLYLELLASGSEGPDEMRALAEVLTVNETYFYRNPDHLRALVETIIPERRTAPGMPRRLRVLSAGCSSGEEAYSVAIALRHHLPDIASWDIAIHAVDVSPRVIEKAIRARYSAWSLRETPPEIRDQYFRLEGAEYVLDESIRAMVSFEERNLIVDDPSRWPAGAYDVVFCRNVIMYLAPAVAGSLIDRLRGALSPGGFLFLGHAETLRGISNAFRLCHSHNTFYYRQRVEFEVANDPARQGVGSVSSSPVAPAGALDPDGTWFDVIRASTRRVEDLAVTSSLPAGWSTRPIDPPRESPSVPLFEGGAELGLALELLRQERFAEALETIQELPAESADNSDTQVFRALLLTHCGEVSAAERVCREVLGRDDLNAGAHYLLALCLEHAGDRAGAVEHDQDAIYLDPAFAMPHLHLGLLARRQGDRATARHELQQALVMISREDSSRVLFFGGGFNRKSLTAMCLAELRACEEAA